MTEAISEITSPADIRVVLFINNRQVHAPLLALLKSIQDQIDLIPPPTDVAAVIDAAPAKTTPVDADELGLVDSADGDSLKSLSWGDLKTTLDAYFDPQYPPQSRSISASGLATGGGNLTADRTIDVPIASQGEAETGTDNDVAMTPLRVSDRLAVTPGVAKAWVNFSGAGSATVNASHNIASVVRNSTGNYTVTFAAAMADVNYVVLATIGSGANFAGMVMERGPSALTKSTTAFNIYCANASGTLEDATDANIAVFR